VRVSLVDPDKSHQGRPKSKIVPEWGFSSGTSYASGAFALSALSPKFSLDLTTNTILGHPPRATQMISHPEEGVYPQLSW